MLIFKPGGLFYLNAPSNRSFHRYPVDCWRFYPDSGHALITWAKRNGMNPALLESYTSAQIEHEWNDFVAVFLKNAEFAHHYPGRIINKKENFSNGLILNSNEVLRFSELLEDKKKLDAIKI